MKIKRIIFWTLLIVWMGIIFMMSAQPSIRSTETSSPLAEFMIKIFYPEYETSSAETQVLIYDSCQNIVRKTAHFTEYAILGFLCLGACLSTFKRKNFWISLAICVLYAISDEVHQIFVPGRAGRISDVLIDSLGTLAGLLIYIKMCDKFKFLTKNEGKYEEV